MKTFLHVGCGPKYKNHTFNTPEIIGAMTDMSAVADASVDAIFE